jgi:hypothetical protein
MSLAKARFEMVFDCRNAAELTSLGLPERREAGDKQLRHDR